MPDKPKHRKDGKTALTDASSAILLYKAGCFQHMAEAYRLAIPQKAMAELTVPHHPGADFFQDGRENGLFSVLALNGMTGGGDFPANLDPDSGEGETIRCFLGGEGDFVILDDKAGAKYCRDRGIPYLNALLCPRILLFSGKLGRAECEVFTRRIAAIGRYSQRIRNIAFSMTADELHRFMPKQ